MKLNHKFLKPQWLRYQSKTNTLDDVYGPKKSKVVIKRLKIYLVGLTLLLVLSVLIGCMVGSDYERPVLFENEMIEKSLNLKPIQTDNEIYLAKVFNDDLLDELIQRAKSNSPTIRSALIKIRQSRAGLKIDEASLFPTLDIDTKYNYMNESKNLGYIMEQDYYQAAFDMSWEIDIFGGNRRRVESAEADYRGTVENLKNVYVSLTADVANAYINLRMAEQLLKNANDNLVLQTQIYETVSERFDAGLASEIDLNQAKYLLETTKMSIPQFEYDKTQSQNSLALLVGQLPTTLNDILETQKTNLVSKDFKYNTDKLYELPANVIRIRPDVRVAEEQLISGNAMVGSAIADMFPKISLTGLLGFGSLNFSNLITRNSYEYGYSPQISLPVFHFGALKNNVELQKAIKEEYLIAYETALLNAASEISNALMAIETEKRHNQASKKAYINVKKVSELNWEKYKKGLIGYADVLDSEQRRLSAQTQMVQSNATLYQNIVQYYKSIGGYYSVEQK
ncbi:MAG: TolC family protein [Alphaproteobacteria bacterium]|nr:TolC family protein [Alphaproteobacteria bacterium]